MIERNKEIIRRYIERVWNDHNPSLVDELMDPEHVCHGLRTEVFVTREMVKQAVSHYREPFTDFRIDILDMLAEGDKVASLIRLLGTRREDGMRCYLDELIIHHIKDGKINGSWSLGSEWKEFKA
ncbi:MAG: ester cyclase [Candidatus Thorarchaeota archaeon]